MKKSTIYVVRDAFNEHYPEKAIKSTNPKTIWKELNKKLDTCDREDCWFDLIEDEYLREDLKKQLITFI